LAYYLIIMPRGAERRYLDQEGQDTSLVGTLSSKGPAIAAAILLIVLFDFAMWFIVPDGTTYHRDLGPAELEVDLSAIPLLLTGVLLGSILLVLYWRRRR
jgi:hypothetical protein